MGDEGEGRGGGGQDRTREEEDRGDGGRRGRFERFLNGIKIIQNHFIYITHTYVNVLCMYVLYSHQNVLISRFDLLNVF